MTESAAATRQPPRVAALTPTPRGDLARRLAPAATIVLLTVVAYVPAMRGGFIWDDDYYVTQNATLRTNDGLARIWFDVGATPQYYPLTHTSFWLEYRLWGRDPSGHHDPTGYHVTNVLLHAANAVMLWIVLRKLAVPGAWLAAAVFAVHPVHVESVAWITERKNVLSGFFYFASLLAYLRFSGVDEGTGTGKGRTYAAALALFACALLSKTVTSSLPAAVLLLVWWKRGTISLRRDVVPLLPFFALGVAAGALTGYMEREVVGAKGPEWDALSWADRCLIAGRAVWFYASKLLWPHPLAFMYERWQLDPRSPAQWFFPAAALLLVGWLVAMRHRIGRGPLAAVLFFGGTLFPALGFVNVLPMRYSFVADHFQYLASIGVITLIVGAAATALRRRPLALRGAGAIVLLALGVLTWRQGCVYADLETLWRDTLAKNPTSWMAHNNLGLVLMARGDDLGAAAEFRRVLALQPDNARARLNLGLLAQNRGNVELAEWFFREVLKRDPRSADAHLNLGRLFALQGRLEEGVRHLRTAIKFDPTHERAHNDLGIMLVQQGDAAGALAHLRAAVEIQPDWAEAHANLAAVLAATGDLQAAQGHKARADELRRALQPGN